VCYITSATYRAITLVQAKSMVSMVNVNNLGSKQLVQKCRIAIWCQRYIGISYVRTIVYVRIKGLTQEGSKRHCTEKQIQSSLNCAPMC